LAIYATIDGEQCLGMPRYRRYFAPGQTVFPTIVCHARRPWLRDEGTRHVALAALRNVRIRYPFRHFAHVLLDDHLHLMLRPAADAQVPRLVGSFKRAVQARLPAPLPPHRLWQRRYYDHVIRDAEDFARHLDYLHFNPVKHGLVEHATKWPWSSLPAWIERGVYPADWGDIAPEHVPDVE
jgi:putative transposase